MLVSLLESSWNTTKVNEWYKSTVYETLRSLYSEHAKQIILDRQTARKDSSYKTLNIKQAMRCESGWQFIFVVQSGLDCIIKSAN